MSTSKQHLAASLAAAAILSPLLLGAGHVADASVTPTPTSAPLRGASAAWSLALPSPGPASQSVDTYTSLPSDAKETYKGSGIFTAPISSAMNYDISLRKQNNYGEYGITPESIPGLAIGSIYMKDNAANQFVELAVHERAAYTPFDNFPAPQILSTIIYEGKIQDTKDTFIQLPESVKSAFLNLPLAGEGDPSTPKVAQMAELMTSKVDANWNQADQMLDAQGKLANFDIKSHFSNLTPDQLSQYTLGKTDTQTGHKTPDVITQGLQKMFGDQIVQNAGLPKGPAVWINAKIGGKVTPVLFQQYERVAITVNPNNIDSPTKVTGDMKDAKNKSVVQVGLQGQIVYNGLLAVDTRPSATPTVGKTESPTSVATATARPTQEVQPTVPAEAAVEKVAGKEWFGGFKMEWKLNDGRIIGWSNPEKGKQDLEKNLMLMLIAQGRYGNSVDEVENHLKANPIVDIDLLMYDDTVPRNYPERSPSLVKSQTSQWDIRKPMIFRQAPIPYQNAIKLGDSRYSDALLTEDNQLIFEMSNNLNLMESQLGSYSGHLYINLELAGNLKNLNSYPKDINGKGDILNVIIQKSGLNYDPSFPHVLNQSDFITYTENKSAYAYHILGLQH